MKTPSKQIVANLPIIVEANEIAAEYVKGRKRSVES
jgi:hypothetical protein